MPSWGKSASPQASADFDTLLNSSIGFAKKQLDNEGEFYPYAVIVNVSDGLQMVGSEISEDRPASAAVISSLVKAVRAQKDSIRAVAIVSCVHERDAGSDAVRVTFEHAEGLTSAVLLPYKSAELGSKGTYGDLRRGNSAPAIWAD